MTDRDEIIDAAMEALCRQSHEVRGDMGLRLVIREWMHHVWNRGQFSILDLALPKDDAEQCPCGALLTDANRLDVYGDGEVCVCSVPCLREQMSADRAKAVDRLIEEGR